ncbi:SPFH domain-containing protein [Streptomyces pratensis]|uniref:SPFH domain-containing protein n=1 Tax=Streptomyces pratensis TaxID=1169025 RepID=UPI003018D0F2
MTLPDDDQTTRTTPTDHTPRRGPADGHLPPSLFDPPGKRAAPPPLFDDGRACAAGRPVTAETPPPLFGGGGGGTGETPSAPRPGRGEEPPPLFRRVGGDAPPPLFGGEDGGGGEAASGASAGGAGGVAPPADGGADGSFSPSPGRADRDVPPPLFGAPAVRDDGTEGAAPPPAGAAAPPPAAPPPAAPPPEGVSASPRATAPANVTALASPPAGAGAEEPAPECAAPPPPPPAAEPPDGGRARRTADDGPAGPAPAGGRTGSAEGGGPLGTAAAGTSVRPVPLDGNLYFKPARRSRTEASAEWTPHPSYGAEPVAGAAGRGAAAEESTRGAVTDPGPDTELDLVLDLAAGDRAASATFSVPAAAPASPSAAAAPPAGRRHSVIANESTASIPVHLLFRDDLKPAGATALPAAVTRHSAPGDRAPATRRPPVPRSPQPGVRPSTRPAPAGDPRLVERPGPALPGYAALAVGGAAIAGAATLLWWRGALPAAWQSAVGLAPRAEAGVGAGGWALLALLVTVALLALGGLGRGRVGHAWVLTLFGDYRGSVRRTGLVWISPLLLRRRVDVRLRHWRSEPLPAVDADGTALLAVVLVVWRIEDTVRAALGIEDHEAYLSAQVEAAMARVLSQLPADAFHEDAPTLRDAEAVGDALTRMLQADCEPAGVQVYSAQPTGIEYAPEVAAAMQRRRIAAIDSRHRDSVLTSVVDAVDDTVNRLTARGIVELDDYERKALVRDLTVAFYTGRSGGGNGG